MAARQGEVPIQAQIKYDERFLNIAFGHIRICLANGMQSSRGAAWSR
jgi:hypothetical protein